MTENPEIQNGTQLENGAQNLNAQSAPPTIADAVPRPRPGEGKTLDVEGLNNMQMLMSVQLQVTVELGRTSLAISEVLDLQKGSVVELDRIAGEAVDVFVNGSLIARGDVVVVDDKYGVRITELVPVEERV